MVDKPSKMSVELLNALEIRQKSEPSNQEQEVPNQSAHLTVANVKRTSALQIDAKAIEIEPSEVIISPLHDRWVGVHDNSSLIKDIQEQGQNQYGKLNKVGDQYILVYGLRRLEACQALGIRFKAEVVKELNKQQCLRLMVSENNERQDISYIERGSSILKAENEGLSRDEILDIYKVSRPTYFRLKRAGYMAAIPSLMESISHLIKYISNKEVDAFLSKVEPFLKARFYKDESPENHLTMEVIESVSNQLRHCRDDFQMAALAFSKKYRGENVNISDKYQPQSDEQKNITSLMNKLAKIVVEQLTLGQVPDQMSGTKDLLKIENGESESALDTDEIIQKAREKKNSAIVNKIISVNEFSSTSEIENYIKNLKASLLAELKNKKQ